MHESMRQLFAIAQAQRGIAGAAELARALNASEQKITNWKKRGISEEGALLAQATFKGCDANRLLGRTHVTYTQAPTVAHIAAEPVPAAHLAFSTKWPFELVSQSLYDKLAPAEQFQAQVRMQDEIDKLLAAKAAASKPNARRN